MESLLASTWGPGIEQKSKCLPYKHLYLLGHLTSPTSSYSNNFSHCPGTRLGLVTSEPQRAAGLCLLSIGLRSWHTVLDIIIIIIICFSRQGFNIDSGDQAQVLMIIQQVFYWLLCLPKSREREREIKKLTGTCHLLIMKRQWH